MEYSFSRYLLSKQSVDDRALNRHVYETLVASLPEQPIRVIEVGAGIGTMLTRLLRWGLLKQADYTLVDEMPENIDYAIGLISLWAAEHGLRVENSAQNQIKVLDNDRDVRVNFERANVFDFIQQKPQKFDLLIAHAFLDLLPMPEGLKRLFSLIKPAGLAWLTINFDGVTTLEPSIDPVLDANIERLYHTTMDFRPTGGDSQSGRHLFGHLRSVKAEILAAGASDWVVHTVDGKYPADEAYFLNYILYFFEISLSKHPELDAAVFKNWLAERRKQIERGELVYIAHQMDFLARTTVL
jgi:2-polyprenyl-3-methyl-5-hydroxy-6-metoxy-1,4-benzoquinol methylase